MIIFNALQTSLNGGIGRYSYELAKELYSNNPKKIKLVIRDQDKNLFNFVNKEDLIIAYNINNSKERNVYEQFKLPRLIHKNYPDAIIHYPDSMAPLLCKNKIVITIHDLAFKSMKNIFTWKTNIWKNIITSLSIKKASKIIAITKFTKSEILKYYSKVDKNKICVVYNGFNDFSKEKIEEKNIRNDIKKLDNYILTVSTISPRKNIDGLIRAFNMIKNEIGENLIIAGNNGWMYEDVYNLVEELKLKDRVVFTGKVNDDELKYLYSNSKLFVYTSFYEGFGLPPLEAMSYGIPCIVSDITSIPEVVGNGAVKVNPKDNNEISTIILNTIYNDNRILIENAKYNIMKFSWKKCYEDTFKLYKSLMG